ncbi:tetranectin-like isoform X2 [Narcine bancroftii]
MVTLAMFEDVKKQIEHIVQDVNLLKESQALQSVCLRGMKVDRKCYLPMSGEKSFHRAADDCILHGGLLGYVENEEENQALHQYVSRKMGGGSSIWLGVTDIVDEGRWLDVTSTAVNYTNWQMGSSPQPDGGTKENCVAFSGQGNGKWLDEPCRSLHQYICQYNIP